VTQDVDTEQFYSVGRSLFDNANKMHDAFAVNVSMLGETGAMAGTDDAGTAWARSYDERVAEVLGAVNDLNLAMENYGGVVILAGYNHAIAEHNATVGNRGPAPTMPPTPPSASHTLSVPPSAGGSSHGLFDSAIGLIEQIGVPVPNGDTDKIDKAAAAWDRLATVYQTKTVVEALGVEARIFSDSKTPEDDYIAKDIGELRTAAQAILDGCSELAESCREYKAHLEELRDQLQSILEELAVELAVTAAISILSSFVSFGVAAVAGTAKAAQSITKYAKIIRDAIAVSKLAEKAGQGVKKVADVPGVRKMLERLKNIGKKERKPETPKRGRVDESAKPFSQEERKIADLLAGEGKEVTAVKESSVPGQRTADAVVDGKPTEFKSVADGATNTNVKNALDSAKGQADNAIVDGRGTGLTQEEAQRGLNRFLGANPDRMTSIRIVGDGWQISWP
jgi:hypothetical protein